MLGILRSLALPALILFASQPALADAPDTREKNLPAEAWQPPEKPAPPVIVQDYEPDPAMWRLADEDTTLYFFGTYHVLPEGFRWRSALLEKVIGEADEVVFESRSDDEEEIDFEAIFGGSAESIFAREPVSASLSEENQQKWRKLASDMEMPFFIFDRIPPVLTMLFVGVSISEMEGSQSELGVETILENEFRTAGKPISAIEDPEQVMRNVLAIDEQSAIALLEQTLTEWDGESLRAFTGDEAAEQWAMEHSWARGRLEDEGFEDWGDDPFSRTLYQVLLVDRNREWAGWIEERMKRPGTVLVAVGGGHFVGPDSVQAMLEARGMEVERLNPAPAVPEIEIVPVAPDAG